MTQLAEQASLDPIVEWVDMYRNTRSRIKELEKQLNEAKDKITATLDEHSAEIGTVAGQAVLRYRTVEQRKFDQRRFKTDFPDVADHYYTQSSYRRLDVM